MYEVKDIVEIVLCASSEEKKINNLKLQLLLYFLWIEYYKKYQTYLFINPFRAYENFPICVDVYYNYTCYGGHFIKPNCRKANEILDKNKKIFKDLDFLFKTVEKYNSLSVSELLKIINDERTAYYKYKRSKSIISFIDIIKLDCTNLDV